MNPASVAETYWQLHQQPRDAWTFELDLRPYGEKVVRWTEIEFHFDFGSPNAYLAHLVIPGIEARTGARVRYVPVLLGGVFKATNNGSPVEVFRGIPNKREYSELETRALPATARHHRLPPQSAFPGQHAAVMRGAIAAQRTRLFRTLRRRGLPAHVVRAEEDGRAGGDPGGARRELASTPSAARAAPDPEVKQELIANTEASVARGTFGSPSFFVGDELFFGKDRLRDVEEEFLRRRSWPGCPAPGFAERPRSRARGNSMRGGVTPSPRATGFRTCTGAPSR